MSRFQLLSAEHTGIDFINTIEETDSFNMLTFMNIYTGGGVAVGDINNDGLEDLFFSGNRVPSKLYLNKGDLKFEDITQQAGIKTNRWCAGASMVDINNDGLLDIYISVSGSGNEAARANLLFENQGAGKFVEKAATYGLAETGQCMHTSFFDYDRDGDLDAYMIINPVNYTLGSVNVVKPKLNDGKDPSVDKLYRNDDGKFTEVSAEAGVKVEGYSLGVATADINGDDWPDIYVSNDFLTNDILYINNQDGTFSNQAGKLLDHTSFAGMGNDVADFNNDGLPDIVVADMLPEDNLRRQKIIPAASYDKFQLTQQMGYEPQYTRNTLQLNNGDGTFSEVGQLAGIDKTDWSWSCLFADYDNDGDKDLFVSNGFLRDVGNLDYITYQRKQNNGFGNETARHKKRLEAIQDLGAAKIPNYIFENQGAYTFSDESKDWGLQEHTCSNGAAFADLDQDGDLELIINNVNDRAFIYENLTNQFHNAGHYLKIQLKGHPQNPQGVGAKIYLQTSGGMQYQQHTLYRGYESTVSTELHFGLGSDSLIQKLTIIWPDGFSQTLENIPVDQTLVLRRKDAEEQVKAGREIVGHPTRESKKDFPWLKDRSKELGLDYVHQELEYVDFKIQALLPHKHSENGPGIAVGDVNGDGLSDVYIGGSAGFDGQLYLQNDTGFEKSEQRFDTKYEDMGCLFFDADQDGDQDLYIVSGGSSEKAGSALYEDRLYQNDGNGNFERIENLPLINSSGASVIAGDYDKDGDLDLFVAGRTVPGAYPSTPRSTLLRNDSQKGTINFVDVSNDLLPNNGNLGMVSAALWTDFDNNGWLDLMLVGEWMAPTFIKNENGKLSNHKGIAGTNSGWWNSITAGDFDNDGDIDYVAGNLGLNSRYKASEDHPFCVYAKDYDKNGRIDPVLCQYIGEESYIAHPRDQLIQQINSMRVRFKTYEDYGRAIFTKSFREDELADVQLLKSTNFASSYFENRGDGTFSLTPLPMEAQLAPVFGMQSTDVNQDGFLDLVLLGNSFATAVDIGRYDALDGLVLLGDGTGSFQVLKSWESGLLVEEDAKGVAQLYTADAFPLSIITTNAGPLKVYQGHQARQLIPLAADDQYAICTFKNDNDNDRGQRKIEFYFGDTYLSQSERQLNVPANATSIIIVNTRGEKREINIR